ncbi:arf-GAP with coiled-coil, ANK repeat and PH domain-containing protein 2-like [Trichomycterus rosablanca]|uniref:arf-GAP with coiled-coil, ANK repeat and PH domain-containing protein 2-like n=1 Tax=Trichomycterus rosablanca TaxID=2290929 RepID=UPI002F35DEE4
MASPVMQRFLCLIFCGAPPQTFSQDDSNDEGRQEDDLGVENRILMEGFLYKKSSSVFKTWKRRFFIIQNNQLLYEKRFKRNLTVLMEDLQLCSVQCCEDVRRRFCFQVVSPTKSRTFQADSEASRQAWIEAICNVAHIERTEETEKSEGCEVRSESNSIQIVSNGEMKLEVLEDSHQPQASSKPPAMAREVGEVICDVAVENNDAEGKIDNEGRQEEMTTNTNLNNLNHKESFDSQYSTGKLLGKGGCGSVYEGVCKADGKQVIQQYLVTRSPLNSKSLTLDALH